LLVDDDESFRRVVQYMLEEASYDVTIAGGGEEALELVGKVKPDLILSDVKMGGMTGIELLGKVRETRATPVVIMTAFGSIELAVEAMKMGADDFLTKPFHRDELLRVVEKAMRVQKLESENRYLRSQLRSAFDPKSFVGVSAAFGNVVRMAERLAASDVSVLLRGESGTGKEVIAKAIHFHSERAGRGRFVPINCSAIPRELLESELFGHVKGSFTGAVADRIGKFEAADGGTLFLDEIGDMPAELQAKILRALQEKEIERVGGDGKPRPVDVRVLAATHRDLSEMIEEGTFREDLYYRLAVVELKIPPLRERPDDILPLVEHFIARHARGGVSPKLTADARKALLACDWPGNVRELENAIQRALALAASPDEIAAGDLPDAVRSPSRGSRAGFRIGIPEGGIVLDQVEAQLIETALEKTGGNQTRAADLLGITRQTLIYRIQKYGIRAGGAVAAGGEADEEA
jgi:two-component system NtrC family response regulator